MNLPRLLLITDDQPDLARRVEQALAGGVRHILLRAKGASAQTVCTLTSQLLPLVRAVQGWLLVHDRLDVALAMNTDGVHLPADGLPTAMARRLLGQNLLLGRSCHSPDQASLALEQGADYVTLSPVYPTLSHPGAKAMGLEQFAAGCASIQGPVLALGGIQEKNIQEVLHAGAYGVAMIRAILDQQDVAGAARAIGANIAPSSH